MELIRVTKENIASEHICCAISNNTDCQVAAKKSWLSERFDDGLVFLKGNVRGKCFIEYIPAEKAWSPVAAEGYMFIDCLWVSGQFKGQGNSTLLLNECIRDSRAQGKLGLAILSAKKKMAFLADPGFLKHEGFLVADTADPYYVLYYLPFVPDAMPPRFREQVKHPHTSGAGFELYYSFQCPFTAKYVPIIENIAKEKGVSFKAVKLETCKQAQAAPAPFTAYSLFFNGEFITNEIQSEKKFAALVDSLAKA